MANRAKCVVTSEQDRCTDNQPRSTGSADQIELADKLSLYEVCEEKWLASHSFETGPVLQVIMFALSDEGSSSAPWQMDLLTALFEVNVEAIRGFLKPQSKNFKMELIDKLDLAELLNCPRTIEACEDINKLESVTRDCEFIFPSFLDSMKPLISHISTIYSKHINSIVPGFGSIRQCLLQYPYWVHANYVDAFIANNAIHRIGNGLVLCGTHGQSVVLCFRGGAISNPSHLLQCYKTSLLQSCDLDHKSCDNS